MCLENSVIIFRNWHQGLYIVFKLFIRYPLCHSCTRGLLYGGSCVFLWHTLLLELPGLQSSCQNQKVIHNHIFVDTTGVPYLSLNSIMLLIFVQPMLFDGDTLIYLFWLGGIFVFYLIIPRRLKIWCWLRDEEQQ